MYESVGTCKLPSTITSLLTSRPLWGERLSLAARLKVLADRVVPAVGCGLAARLEYWLELSAVESCNRPFSSLFSTSLMGLSVPSSFRSKSRRLVTPAALMASSCNLPFVWRGWLSKRWPSCRTISNSWSSRVALTKPSVMISVRLLPSGSM